MSLRLDLGSGPRPREGFVGVDIAGGEGIIFEDLFRFPWRWEDDSVDEIWCSHFIEHLPLRDIRRDDVYRSDLHPQNWEPYIEKDYFFAFFDECWRVLRSGGKAIVTVPAQSSDIAYRDPTHRRFFVAETFDYLSHARREALGVGHYRVACDFSVEVVPILDEALQQVPRAALRSQAERQRNIIIEYRATLTKAGP